jgi:hypothetical protein
MSGAADAATQSWMPGWDFFSEPLNLTTSNVVWSVSSSRKLTVTYTLRAAVPSKLYQVGVHLFCNEPPPTFGQFPIAGGATTCGPITRQGKTASVAAVELGVVTTDAHGNGTFKVVVGPVLAGTYRLEFTVRNGAGCNLIGGSGSTNCGIDFQSPGPFDTTTSVTIP